MSSASEVSAAHARMDAPFGVRVEHGSELQANIIDPRSIQIVSLDNPRAFLYKRFMSDAECDFMVVGRCGVVTGVCAARFLAHP